jgi:hypothetical protein
MRPCGYKLGHGMCEGGVGRNIKDRNGVLPIIHAAGGKYDGDEVYAGVVEKRRRAGLCEKLGNRCVRAILIARGMGCLAYPDVYRRNIADDIPLVVDHRQRCDAFAVQQDERFFERLVTTAGEF